MQNSAGNGLAQFRLSNAFHGPGHVCRFSMETLAWPRYAIASGDLRCFGDTGVGVMSEELDTAKRYRVHAEELRVIAEQDRDGETRRMLLRVADDYDHMARTLEAIDQTNKAVRRHREPS
jgi:hypothetical protein